MCKLLERKNQTDKLNNMKVINGNRRELEKMIIHTLMNDARNKEIDNEIDRLKPIGRLKLVTTSTNCCGDESLPTPESLHQNKLP